MKRQSIVAIFSKNSFGNKITQRAVRNRSIIRGYSLIHTEFTRLAVIEKIFKILRLAPLNPFHFYGIEFESRCRVSEYLTPLLHLFQRRS